MHDMFWESGTQQSKRRRINVGTRRHLDKKVRIEMGIEKGNLGERRGVEKGSLQDWAGTWKRVWLAREVLYKSTAG